MPDWQQTRKTKSKINNDVAETASNRRASNGVHVGSGFHVLVWRETIASLGNGSHG